MLQTFPTHGEFALALDGRILVNQARGPWNTELAAAYGRAVNDHVKTLHGQYWAVLAFVSGEPIHTPDAREQMVAALREHRAHGRCATAILFQEVAGEALLRLVHTSNYAAAGEPLLFADNEAHARAWLQQQLSVAAARQARENRSAPPLQSA